jgi:hypothetical protein
MNEENLEIIPTRLGKVYLVAKKSLCDILRILSPILVWGHKIIIKIKTRLGYEHPENKLELGD